MQSEEGRRLSDLIKDIMFFCACSLFIGIGLMSWVTFRPDIRQALQMAQGFLFG
jgi:hypothetical protein